MDYLQSSTAAGGGEPASTSNSVGNLCTGPLQAEGPPQGVAEWSNVRRSRKLNHCRSSVSAAAIKVLQINLHTLSYAVYTVSLLSYWAPDSRLILAKCRDVSCNLSSVHWRTFSCNFCLHFVKRCVKAFWTRRPWSHKRWEAGEQSHPTLFKVSISNNFSPGQTIVLKGIENW